MQTSHATPQFPLLLAPFDLRTTAVLRTEVLVIGSGIAGAAAALAAADDGVEVLLVTKDALDETNTAWAQGGIAVVQLPEDSIEQHVADTLRVGAGIATPEVVRHVVEGAGDAIAWLEGLGTHFDRTQGAGADARDGTLELSREGGHSHPRVVHSHGAATGREIQRALVTALQNHPRITVRPNVFVRDLIVHEGRCVGVVGLQNGRLQRMELAVEAGAVIVATGGTGQIYRETTNPTGACGDGHALCFRAGARLADCEFVQFHPTTLYIAGASRFLISEAVRGAGAVLRDRTGERFMLGVHPLAELAPRDVVSRAILDRMVATNDTHVYLDLASVDGDPTALFPSIARICSTFDLDLAHDPIPVRPGAHYFLGGAATDLDGRTTVDGLFAVGEAAASGLHGANRLASNSLLEAVVLGARAAADIKSIIPLERAGHFVVPQKIAGPKPFDKDARARLIADLRAVMTAHVGVMRTAEGLKAALAALEAIGRKGAGDPLVANMVLTSRLIAAAALKRKESRGGHYRSDYPAADPAQARRTFISLRDLREAPLRARNAGNSSPAVSVSP